MFLRISNAVFASTRREEIHDAADQEAVEMVQNGAETGEFYADEDSDDNFDDREGEEATEQTLHGGDVASASDIRLLLSPDTLCLTPVVRNFFFPWSLAVHKTL